MIKRLILGLSIFTFVACAAPSDERVAEVTHQSVNEGQEIDPDVARVYFLSAAQMLLLAAGEIPEGQPQLWDMNAAAQQGFDGLQQAEVGLSWLPYPH